MAECGAEGAEVGACPPTKPEARFKPGEKTLEMMERRLWRRGGEAGGDGVLGSKWCWDWREEEPVGGLGAARWWKCQGLVASLLLELPKGLEIKGSLLEAGLAALALRGDGVAGIWERKLPEGLEVGLGF